MLGSRAHRLTFPVGNVPCTPLLAHPAPHAGRWAKDTRYQLTFGFQNPDLTRVTSVSTMGTDKSIWRPSFPPMWVLPLDVRLVMGRSYGAYTQSDLVFTALNNKYGSLCPMR